MLRRIARLLVVAVPLLVGAFVFLGFWPTTPHPVDETLHVDHEPEEFGPAKYFPENDTVRFWTTGSGSDRAFEPFEVYACWYGKEAARDAVGGVLDQRFTTGDTGVRWAGDFDRIVIRDAPFQGPTRGALHHSLPGRVNVSVRMFDRTAECSFPVEIRRPTGERPQPG